MPVQLKPLKQVKCTFDDCANSFSSDEQMKSHKRREHEHEYCHKCDEDFKDYNDLVFHKIVRPNEHDRACRVCGDDFKTTAGLKRHIELNHKVDQVLTCRGCAKSFYRACLFIEHLEYNHCNVIPALQFVKHIIHKQLTFELLNNMEAKRKFNLKQAKYDATQDLEIEGGINLEAKIFDDSEARTIEYKALEPEAAPVPELPNYLEPYPPLPSLKSATRCELAPTLSTLGRSVHDTSSVNGSVTTASSRRSKAWEHRSGKSSGAILFPKPTPVTEEFSISAYGREIEKVHGVNAFKERFWDPDCKVYNAERFYDAITTKYYCPFVCDQTLDTIAHLNYHIRKDHSIDRMKCPLCCKYFQSATALMAHCEALNSRCKIGKAENFGIFLDRFTGGFLAVEDEIRPDHLENPAALVRNPYTGRMEPYRPPIATYLRFRVTTPPDFKQPVKTINVSGYF